MISCRDAVRQLWSYLDGTLDEVNRQEMDQHLDVCRRCCGEVDFAVELRSFLSEHAQENVPPEVTARLNRFLEEI